jgi:hypothetical protein
MMMGSHRGRQGRSSLVILLGSRIAAAERIAIARNALLAKIKLVRFAKITHWPFCPITAVAPHQQSVDAFTS